MITLNLPRIALLKGIQRPYTFLVRNGFTPQTAKGLISGRIKRLDMGHLEKLCRLFQCEPYDLFDYRQDKNCVLPEKDHLAFLAKPKAEVGLHSLIADLSFKQMEELVADVSRRYKAA